MSQRLRRIQMQGDDLTEYSGKRYRLLTAYDEVCAYLNSIPSGHVVAVDTETTGLHPYNGDRLGGISLSRGEGDGVYIPVSHAHTHNISIPEIRGVMNQFFMDGNIRKVFHHAKFDCHFLTSSGFDINFNTVDDTLMMVFLIDENVPDKSLKGLAKAILDPDADQHEIRLKEMLKKAGVTDYTRIPGNVILSYAASDAEYTIRLYHTFMPVIQSDPKIAALYQAKMRVMPALLAMEREGVYIDSTELDRLDEQLQRGIVKKKHEIYRAVGGKPFNVDSNAEVSRILFGVLKLTPPFTTKGKKPSTDKKALKRLRDQHSMPNLLLEYRALSKLKSTYVDGIRERMSGDGRLHTSLNQTVARTNRLCVAGDTSLETSIGKFCISDLNLTKSQNILILTHKGRWRRILRKFFKGQEDMYEVKLQSGASIKCTAGHRFLTPAGWQHLASLSVGDSVCEVARPGEQVSPHDIMRRRLRSAGDPREAHPIGYGGELRGYLRAVGLLKESLSGEVCVGTEANAVAEPRTCAPWEPTGSQAASGHSNTKGSARTECRQEVVRAGAGIRDDRVVHSAQLGYLRSGQGHGASLQDAAHQSRISGETGILCSGDNREGAEVLRRSAWVLSDALPSILPSERIALVHQGSGQSPQILLSAEEDHSARSHLLVGQSERAFTFDGASGSGDSTCPSVLLSRSLCGGLLLFGAEAVGRGGWELPCERRDHEEARHTSPEESNGAWLPDDSFYGSGSAEESTCCARQNSTGTIISITPIGVQDVWDIEVEEDHSYVAQGFVNHNSSSDPNLQNISGRSQQLCPHCGALVEKSESCSKCKGRMNPRDAFQIRALFCAPPDSDYIMWFIDQSQIEIRVAAHFTQEPVLLDAFFNHKDVHSQICSEFFHIPYEQFLLDPMPSEVKEKRKRSKPVTFGKLYGATDKGLQEYLETWDVYLTEEECYELSHRFDTSMPVLKMGIQRVIEECRNLGYVETVYGFKRHLPDIVSPVEWERERAERQAFNVLIQGTCAGMLDMAMMKNDHDLQGMLTTQRLPIHDEIWGYMHRSELDVLNKLKRNMEDFPWMSLPVEAVCAWSTTNWANKKELK